MSTMKECFALSIFFNLNSLLIFSPNILIVIYKNFTQLNEEVLRS